jgi:hypothetical protein
MQTLITVSVSRHRSEVCPHGGHCTRGGPRLVSDLNFKLLFSVSFWVVLRGVQTESNFKLQNQVLKDLARRHAFAACCCCCMLLAAACCLLLLAAACCLLLLLTAAAAAAAAAVGERPAQ